MRSCARSIGCVLFSLAAALCWFTDAGTCQEPLFHVEGLAAEQVSSPQIIKRVPPEYTESARSAHITGRVLLSMVVDRNGFPREIEVLRPLGFGLTEKAIEAISQWRFRPGSHEGKPVDVYATVMVGFDQLTEKAKQRREHMLEYNKAVGMLQQSAKDSQKGVQRIHRLAKSGMPEAAYTYGLLHEEGRLLPKDIDAAHEWYRKAAKDHYPNAIARLALAEVLRENSNSVPDAIRRLQEAAESGSNIAQRWLAFQYLDGTLVPADVRNAERMFRFCAAYGDAHCQMWLGKVMLSSLPKRDPSTPMSMRHQLAVAWLSIAVAANEAGAKELLDPQLAALRAVEIKSAMSRKNIILQSIF